MFEEKVDQSVKQYEELIPMYYSYSETIRNILNSSLPKELGIQTVQYRAKTKESFKKKASKLDENDETKLRYPNPLIEITDLAGIRVITFFPKSIERICDIISREFELLEKKDIGEERFNQGRFGYQSIHHLVKMHPQRNELTEYKKFNGMIAEIQVRTILQHAWAEMEHDIQYKSLEQIPKTIKKRFISLAGLIEIADREFQAIQDEDYKLRDSVQASLQDDLTQTAISGDMNIARKINTMPNDSIQQFPESIVENWNPKKARDLIASGDYKAAVDHYTKMMSIYQGNHTLYIGRAKARFLKGDTSGALDDLEIAEELNPNDPSIENIRVKIKDGLLVNNSNLSEAWQLVTRANDFLANCNGQEAFSLYSQAQSLGFNFIFSSINKAMALVLTEDYNGSKTYLDQVYPIENSPTEINYLALKALIASLSSNNFADDFNKLKNKLDSITGFDFEQSPLRHLEKGLNIKHLELPNQVIEIFEILRQNFQNS